METGVGYLLFLIVLVVWVVITIKLHSNHRKVMELISHTTPGEKYLNIQNDKIYVVHYTANKDQQVVCSELNGEPGNLHSFKRRHFQNHFIRVSALIDE